MNIENNSSNQYGDQRHGLEKLFRPAKVLGVTALSGIAGYAMSKGYETFMPTGSSTLFETVIAGGAALIGGFVAAETIDTSDTPAS